MLNHFGLLLVLIFGLFVYQNGEPIMDQSVYEVHLALGGEPVLHEVNPEIQGVSAEKGKELFHTGVTTKPNGKKTKKQSKHFLCTSCHNNVKEDPNLGNPNPEDRLNYARSEGLPFLQGTTMYGVTNRRTFYNDDYRLKYGDETVNKVKTNLRESIQLCAVGCAQGRALNTWEIESILAYYWSLELQMDDLNLSANEQTQIENALQNGSGKEDALKLLNSKYLQAAPAHFHKTPDNYEEGYAYEGDADNGELIFKLSCLHCHENGRYSYYFLDTESLSLQQLEHHFGQKNSPYNSYNLIAKGTLPVFGDKAYMPQYPVERLSKQQIEDLRAYVSQ